MKKSEKIITKFYPEFKVGGYTSVDGTVEFYSRVESLLNPSMKVLDFGAGRGKWEETDNSNYRRKVRQIKGKVAKVVGCDIDKAVLSNPTTDENVQIAPDNPFPFKDGEFDLIISDYTFEHIAEPQKIAAELHRILKKGGWICARTPNKYGYIPIITRIIKNSYHKKALRYAQPERKEIDIFPTTFKLNSLRDISKYFSEDQYQNLTYRYESEPAYFFNNTIIFMLFYSINKVLPSLLRSNLFIFLKKK